MMNITFKELLQIEELSELYQYRFRFRNFLMWPYIRYKLFQSTLNEMNNLQVVDHSRKNILGKLNYILLSWFKSPLRISKKFDIVIFGTDVANINLNGKYFNRLCEYFANVNPNNSLIVEHANLMGYKRPRTYKNLVYHDWIIIKARIFSLLRTNKNKSTVEIDKFVSFLKSNYAYKFKDEAVWKDIKSKLYRFEAILDLHYNYYFQLLSNTKPSIVFIEDACYGDYQSTLVKVAKELGVYVCEYQHGLISKYHPAYNYSTSLAKEYLQYMPDEYLVFGEYWQKEVNLPIKMRVIGNPHLAETKKTLKNLTKNYTITFISSSLHSNVLVDLIKAIHQREPGYRMALRPHPSEFELLNERYGEIIDIVNVEKGSLYELIAISENIVSEISTVVYEALSFNINVLVIDSKSARENSGSIQFNFVTNCDEILCNLKTNKMILSNFVWEEQWKENYITFLNEHNIKI